MAESTPYPRLRSVEAFPVEEGGHRLLVIHDPSGYASGPVTASPAAMFIFMLLDGAHGPEEIQQAFAEQFHQTVSRQELDELVTQLDAARYLDSPAFAAYMESLVAEFRKSPTRTCRDLSAYGLDGDGSPEDHRRRIETDIRGMLAGCEAALVGPARRRLAGLIAPHLDYGRGAPCYADAYGVLSVNAPPQRVVILGTNHYGHSFSVVATGKDFETPLGLSRTDRAFLDALQARCGVDLCAHEFDHAREHSVELQVLLLQSILGPNRFEMVAALCPDPCGPTGTAPRDGQGVDLRVFAEALGELIRADDRPTLIIAGADLSHVGSRFGDQRELEPLFLADVARKDREAITAVVSGQQDAFVRILAARENATRVCSAGCIYALRTALAGAEGELLRYHQAVDAPSGTCVTCCAAAFWA